MGVQAYKDPLPEPVFWGILVAVAVLPLLSLLYTLLQMGWQRWGPQDEGGEGFQPGLISGDAAADLKGRSGKYNDEMRARDRAEADSIKQRVSSPGGKSMV